MLKLMQEKTRPKTRKPSLSQNANNADKEPNEWRAMYPMEAMKKQVAITFHIIFKIIPSK